MKLRDRDWLILYNIIILPILLWLASQKGWIILFLSLIPLSLVELFLFIFFIVAGDNNA